MNVIVKKINVLSEQRGQKFVQQSERNWRKNFPKGNYNRGRGVNNEHPLLTLILAIDVDAAISDRHNDRAAKTLREFNDGYKR